MVKQNIRSFDLVGALTILKNIINGKDYTMYYGK